MSLNEEKIKISTHLVALVADVQLDVPCDGSFVDPTSASPLIGLPGSLLALCCSFFMRFLLSLSVFAAVVDLPGSTLYYLAFKKCTFTKLCMYITSFFFSSSCNIDLKMINASGSGGGKEEEGKGERKRRETGEVGGEEA